jgi:hypothetical protein
MTPDTQTNVPRPPLSAWYATLLFLGAVTAVWSGIAWAFIDLLLLQ